jgi:PAS domain S-box-containing protein
MDAALEPRLDAGLDAPEGNGTARAGRQRFGVLGEAAGRAGDHALMLVAVALHNRFILGEFDVARFTHFAVGLVLYSLLSGLLLVWSRRRVRGVDVRLALMAADLVAWTVAIYVSGAERSWLFFLLILRAGDPRAGSRRRVLGLGVLAVAAYATMLAYVSVVTHRSIAPAPEIAKLVILACANLCLGGMARGVARSRAALATSLGRAHAVLAERDATISAMRESEEFYRTVFDTVTEPIMTARLDGTITRVNRALEALSGYSRDELIGHHYSLLTTTAIVESSEDRKRRAIAGADVGVAEVVAILKNGEHVPFEVRSAILRDQTGQPTGAVGIYRDLRPHKVVEHALDRARELAEDTSRARNALLAAMAQELQAPLNAITGFSRLLLHGEDGSLAERQRSYVTAIEERGTHLLELLASVLELARMDAARQPLTIETVDVAGIVDECLQAARPFTAGKPITLEREVPPGLPPLHADRLKVRQVLLNVVTTVARSTTAGRVLVAVRAEADALAITVAHTGEGVADSQLPLGLEPAYRMRGRQGATGRASSAGLTLTKRLVELHGGRISMESEPGHGTSFHIRLPLTRGA